MPEDEIVVPDATDEAGKPPPTVPYHRFQTTVTERNTLRTELATVKRENQSLTEKAATADTLATQLREEQSGRAREKAEWETERGLIDVGLVDPEWREVAKAHWAKQPEAGRKPPKEWWEAMKAEPTKAPKILQSLLAPVVDPDADPDAEEPEEEAPARRPNTRLGADPNAGGAATGKPLSAAKLAEIRTKAAKTGDWTEWKRVTGRTK